MDRDFKDTILEIKNEISKTQTLVMSDANVRLINMYFNIGKIINEKSKWGSKFIQELEIELKIDYPNSKGFSARNLRRMKRFYLEYENDGILPPAVAKLPWTHNNILIEKIKDREKRVWYANEAINSNWSKVVLDHQIDLGLYERKAAVRKENNFKNALINPQSDLANDLQKDPYIFNLPLLKDKYIEKELEESMLNRIRDVLLEFGKGFSFVGNQYKISTEDNDYYIDLLFYHLDLRCYVVVELKNTKFQPEFVGQLSFYVTAVNKVLKKENDNETIGLLLCRDKDRLSVEWSLESVNTPIGVSSYELEKSILDSLPTEEEINLHIDIDDGEMDGEENV